MTGRAASRSLLVTAPQKAAQAKSRRRAARLKLTKFSTRLRGEASPPRIGFPGHPRAPTSAVHWVLPAPASARAAHARTGPAWASSAAPVTHPPRPAPRHSCTRAHRALLTCFAAAQRETPPSRLRVRAPRPARRSSGPPLGGPRPRPSAVTCCWGRRPPHTTPGCGDDGGCCCSLGSHMRPPGAPASRPRRHGPPRSARIRGAGPAAGANAAPPLRL